MSLAAVDATKPTSTAPCAAEKIISAPSSFDKVIVPLVFKTAVTSDTSLLIILTKSEALLAIATVSLLIVKVVL